MENANEIKGRKDVDELDTVRQLAIIQTKLDIVIKAQRDSDAKHSYTEQRIDALEAYRNKLMGITTAMVMVSGSIAFASYSAAHDIAQQEINDTDFIGQVCREVRGKSLPYEEWPQLCKI